MKRLAIFSVLASLFLGTNFSTANDWQTIEGQRFDLYFQESDRAELVDYQPIFEKACTTAEQFFGQPFPQKFQIYLHPDRASLDAQWQRDWQMPDFKSECWMVASGVAAKLDLIAPKKWDTESCEHRWADQAAVQRLIAHEMAHVFHGQRNASPDFSDVSGLDWFVEGLAVYASGQCDSARLAPAKMAVQSGKAPAALDDFWKGKLKYGLSGSVVMYLDQRFGREKLLALLPFNRKADLLAALGISEEALLAGWREFLLSK